MTARIIDGRAIAAELRARVATGVAELTNVGGLRPGLAVVLVGEDAASRVYVANKVQQCEAVGMSSRTHCLPPETAEGTLLDLIVELNRDTSVHGILVQFPLPPQIDASAIVSAIAPEKDVDGFHPLNVGQVASGAAGALTPCTPLGVMHLIGTARSDLTGLGALVVGASNVVGKPMARLLLESRCTVSIAHVHTTDLARRCREADILIVATGVPGLVRGNHIKPGATVIDVGITRRAGPDGRNILLGDVAFEEAVRVAGAITPVPGGVGPMTVAYLLSNTLAAARSAMARERSAADTISRAGRTLRLDA